MTAGDVDRADAEQELRLIERALERIQPPCLDPGCVAAWTTRRDESRRLLERQRAELQKALAC